MRFRYTPEYFRIKLARIHERLATETNPDLIAMLKNMEVFYEREQQHFEDARRHEEALQEGI